MQILQTTMVTLSPPNPKPSLSSSNAISSLSLLPNLSVLSLTYRSPPSTLIRMGGGPRTYPGGVSKWQWKRMQAKKAKQLLKARLARERQIYEMRKRAELKAAVSNLERPWEVVQTEQKTSLFSVSADEQLKVLADRFQKPGGFDMWSENDGPQLFHSPEGLPSARFFPKGVVHSVKPYGRIDGSGSTPKVNQKGTKVRGQDSPRRGKRFDWGGDDKIKGYDSRGQKLERVRKNLQGDDEVFDLSLQGDGSYGYGSKDDNVSNKLITE